MLFTRGYWSVMANHKDYYKLRRTVRQNNFKIIISKSDERPHLPQLRWNHIRDSNHEFAMFQAGTNDFFCYCVVSERLCEIVTKGEIKSLGFFVVNVSRQTKSERRHCQVHQTAAKQTNMGTISKLKLVIEFI